MRRRLDRHFRITYSPIVGLAVAFGALPAAACNDCTIQGRFMEFRATGSAGSAATEAFLELDQTRGSEEAAYVMWAVGVAPLDQPVTAVRLRAGAPEAPGAVLYEFPLVNGVPASGRITQVFEWQPYAGEIPFEQLWDLIQRDPVFVEVVLAGGSPSIAIGPLTLTNRHDFQDILCT